MDLSLKFKMTIFSKYATKLGVVGDEQSTDLSCVFTSYLTDEYMYIPSCSLSQLIVTYLFVQHGRRRCR